MVAAGRAMEVRISAPQLGSLLAGGPAQLGISPFLMAWWLASEEHLAAFFAAEQALTKHYSRCGICKRACETMTLHLHVPYSADRHAGFGQLCLTAARAGKSVQHGSYACCRFIADAQTFPEPPSVRKHYGDLCKMPALVEGV